MIWNVRWSDCMTLLFLALACFLGGGAIALLLGRRFLACRVTSVFAGAGCATGFAGSLLLLVQGRTATAHLPIPLPIGQAVFLVDPLACFFLLPVFFIGFFSSLLLPVRMRGYETPVHFGRQCFFFCMFLAGMVAVLLAADAIFFLMAWECMSMAPFFLLAPEDKNAKQRYASWIYLIVAHLGALPLLLLFAMMIQEAGGASFMHLYAFEAWQSAGFLFVLALLGFGMKMGLAPLHVWMPEAHSLAPVDVTILLSGTMVNIGLYGIMRILGMLGTPSPWWGYTLMILGIASGVMGIVFALAQSDMKRSLAFSSSDNMGIVALALGSGILAALNGSSAATVLLLGGGLLHVWNHSMFKGLLFLSASAAAHATGTTTINSLGGLQKRMPIAGGCMALGAAAISGLPPLNGFMGELLMYMGFALAGAAGAGSESTLLFWLGLFALAGIAGMSLLCFTRLYGLIFLGVPRSRASTEIHPTDPRWNGAMLALAAACVLACLAAPLLFGLLEPVIVWLGVRMRLPVALGAEAFAFPTGLLRYAALVCAGFAGLVGVFFLAYRRKRGKTAAGAGPTWDCGYALPSARMQYTSGGFAQFPATVLRGFLRPRMSTPRIKEIFPVSASATLEAPDWILKFWGKTLFALVIHAADKAKRFQHGLLNAYVLYILVTLIVTLVWAVGKL